MDDVTTAGPRTGELRRPLLYWAARFSLYAPLIAIGLYFLTPRPKLHETELIVGITQMAIVLASFVLAAVALLVGRGHARKDIKRYAAAGAVVNGVLILLGIVGMILLLPALRRVKETFTAGYTLAEMEAMPEVIPGSHKILDEKGGFRLEIPADFIANDPGSGPDMVCVFVSEEEQPLAITVQRLGGRISGFISPEEVAALRSQLPPGGEVEREVVSWGSTPLECFKLRFVLDERILCTYLVQVPLVREAIQITVAGPADRVQDCRELLSLVLTTLKGITYADAVARRQQERPSR